MTDTITILSGNQPTRFTADHGQTYRLRRLALVMAAERFTGAHDVTVERMCSDLEQYALCVRIAAPLPDEEARGVFAVDLSMASQREGFLGHLHVQFERIEK